MVSFLYFYFVIIGDLKEEEEVLQWLITQRTEDRIELVTRAMLETIVQETQYLAVYFCKSSYIQLSSFYLQFIYRKQQASCQL